MSLVTGPITNSLATQVMGPLQAGSLLELTTTHEKNFIETSLVPIKMAREKLGEAGPLPANQEELQKRLLELKSTTPTLWQTIKKDVIGGVVGGGFGGGFGGGIGGISGGFFGGLFGTVYGGFFGGLFGGVVGGLIGGGLIGGSFGGGIGGGAFSGVSQAAIWSSPLDANSKIALSALSGVTTFVLSGAISAVPAYNKWKAEVAPLQKEIERLEAVNEVISQVTYDEIMLGDHGTLELRRYVDDFLIPDIERKDGAYVAEMNLLDKKIKDIENDREDPDWKLRPRYERESYMQMSKETLDELYDVKAQLKASQTEVVGPLRVASEGFLGFLRNYGTEQKILGMRQRILSAVKARRAAEEFDQNMKLELAAVLKPITNIQAAIGVGTEILNLSASIRARDLVLAGD